MIVPISDRARKWGYVIWPKALDNEMHALLGHAQTANVSFQGAEVDSKRVDWQHRRISIGAKKTRSLPASVRRFVLVFRRSTLTITPETQRFMCRGQYLHAGKKVTHAADKTHLPCGMQVVSDLVQQHDTFGLIGRGPLAHHDLKDIDEERDNRLIAVRGVSPTAATLGPEVTERPGSTHKGTHADNGRSWYLREYNELPLCGGLRSGVAT